MLLYMHLKYIYKIGNVKVNHVLETLFFSVFISVASRLLKDLSRLRLPSCLHPTK